MNEFVLKRLKDLMWILFLSALVVGGSRFVYGLGATTNMMDALPWGWWKVFNMIAGAALATSGFVIAAIIYIFDLRQFRAVARLSVLVGFLGYGASLIALAFDVGLPHRGWHPFFMWNPHSFLFEVFWCVSLYWGVTALGRVGRNALHHAPLLAGGTVPGFADAAPSAVAQHVDPAGVLHLGHGCGPGHHGVVDPDYLLALQQRI
jgi:hypothetical protein